MYVVSGASGNTGSIVAEQLLEAGKKVKVISRKAENVSKLVEKGAIPVIGDLQDEAFVDEVFSGAEGVYALIPPKFDAQDFRAYQEEVAENISRSLSKNKVSYVVTLSSYGAHLEQGAGVVSGLYPLEQQLNALSDVHVLHLRAGYFYDNFFGSLPVVKQQGVLGGFPIRGDVKMKMVATRDIGTTAAHHLLEKDFSGNQVLFLSHEQTYTLEEAARILGKAIGKDDLSYVAFPADGAKEAMVGMGMSESLADKYVEFSEAVSSGKLYENLAGDTKPTPTSLHDFAHIFAGAYHAS
jgi:uncharacterized protein YbjT (DUF2867 family)